MTESIKPEGQLQTDKQILGYSRYVVLAACFLAMGVISPYEYAWSSMSSHIGGIYHWSDTQIGWMFTLFVIFESIGTLPGGMLRDKFGPRWVTVAGGFIGSIGILATSWGPSYGMVLIIWCIGSFFVGFVYNTSVTTVTRWFPDKRGLAAGLIAAAFSWGSLPFIFPIRAIPKTSPDSVFFNVIFFMAAIIGSVTILAAIFMNDPPAGWKPVGWVPNAANKRPSEHHFTLGEAMKTWQMWLLIFSFILISSAGLTGISKIVKYSHSFGFTAAAATAAAGGLAISNGLGRLFLGGISEKIGRENAMVISYILCGIFLFMTIQAGSSHQETLFVVAAILAIFFWGPLFSLFPTVINHYFGDVACGACYGMLYAIAKGSGGIYGGVLSAILIHNYGFPTAIGTAAVMAIFAGLLIIPLRAYPPKRATVTAANVASAYT